MQINTKKELRSYLKQYDKNPNAILEFYRDAYQHMAGANSVGRDYYSYKSIVGAKQLKELSYKDDDKRIYDAYYLGKGKCNYYYHDQNNELSHFSRPHIIELKEQIEWCYEGLHCYTCERNNRAGYIDSIKYRVKDWKKHLKADYKEKCENFNCTKEDERKYVENLIALKIIKRIYNTDTELCNSCWYKLYQYNHLYVVYLVKLNQLHCIRKDNVSHLVEMLGSKKDLDLSHVVRQDVDLFIEQNENAINGDVDELEEKIRKSSSKEELDNLIKA